MKYIDLHIHTTHSDGMLSPEALLKRIRQTQLGAFSITDHDAVDGHHEATQLLRETDIELVPGLELSVLHEGADLHILGYLFDPENKALNTRLKELQTTRNSRARKMVEKLENLGLALPYEEVTKIARGASVGRPHIAEALFSFGLTESYLEAFHKYIATGGVAYVPKAKLIPQDAIDLIHQAGGLALLAHPRIDRAINYLEPLVNMGLDGLEIYHYSASRQDRKNFRGAAQKFDLVLSGGSDFHGRGDRSDNIGRSRVPYEYLDTMKERQAKGLGTH